MNKHLIASVLLMLMAWGQQAIAQGVGINTSTPDPSSVLDVYSEKHGILIPRMNTINRMGIQNPARSLLVFDIDSGAFFFFTGSTWNSLSASGSQQPWIQGNGYIYNDASLVGIGTDSVLALLHLHSDTVSPYMLISTQYYNAIIGLDETDGTIFMGRDSSGNIKKQLVIDTLGQVGIGTDTPDERLHLAADTGDVNIKLETPLYNVIIGLDETDGTIVMGRDSVGTKVRHLEIDTAGKVGIGSLDNTAQLNVDGRIKTNELELHSANGSYVIKLDDQGMPDLAKGTNNYLDLYNNVAATFTNSMVDIPWNRQRWAPPTGSAYAHSTSTNNSQISILRAGLYKITYTLSYEGTLLLDAEIETVLQHKTPSGSFYSVGGSTTYSSVGLNLTSNRSSVTKTIIIPLGQGDLIKLQARRSSGGGTISTLPDGCSITIERL
ncbi:hypothetical protein BH09BAC1_BH09BAC1_29330 [soil metagenome]